MQSDDIISLGVGEPDFVTPWNITEHAIYQLEKGYTSYTSNYGIIELRREIAQQIEKQFFASYLPESEILITVGVSEGLDLAFRTILNPGDEVIVPVPNFVCYSPLVHLAGGTAIEVDTSETDFILTREQILKAITPKTKALIIGYPNNPTGAMVTEDQLKDIVNVCKEKNLWLISDEVYNQLVYEDKPLSAATYMKENLILLNGFSKAYAMTGWRIGYVACEKYVMDQMVKIHQYATMCAPIMSQYAALEALKHGSKDMEKMRQSYQMRRNFVYDELLKIGFDVLKPKGAFYIFPSVKKFGLSAEEFAMRLLTEGRVAVVPSTAFAEGINDYVRCCYAASMPDLKEALKRIKAFVSTL
jgi:aminotransferase